MIGRRIASPGAAFASERLRQGRRRRAPPTRPRRPSSRFTSSGRRRVCPWAAIHDGGPVRSRIAIVNGYVLSMNPGVGELERGSVLIEDDRIAAVEPDLGEVDADTIDAAGGVI